MHRQQNTGNTSMIPTSSCSSSFALALASVTVIWFAIAGQEVGGSLIVYNIYTIEITITL